MFEPGNIANPNGRSGSDTATQQLRKALNAAAKSKHTTIYRELALLFFKSDKWKLAMLPYIVPRLRTLEVSGQVVVPFQFILKTSGGNRVPLPEPRKQIPSQVVVSTIKPDKCKVASTTPIVKLRTARAKPTAKRRRNAK